ncbi:hypothetical protein O1R50_10245 [Glycomyces luteolus]|uniref:WD40 repeat protein n=1 Tax=Glycomyces luteolus TaxID=2670330 RepID=A0A9X3P783_9ACTN|nr:hypothetical protein [Glycomyces luteolus]MDA1360006.1 hypothetical protein [Glycomyces luteolus]
MPDSIREVLQGIAGDDGPSRDLAAGAYRRARSIGRRRFAAVAVAVVAGLAMAGGATAAIVDRDGVEEPPPAIDPTDAATTPQEVTPTGTEGHETCGVPDGWTGWGPSDSMGDLDALPDGLVFEVRQDGASADPALVRFEGEEPSPVMGEGGEYYLAPDGSRFAVGGASECAGTLATLTGDKIDGVPVFTVQCFPSWSPDSDRVVLNMADAESTGTYLLDVATGAASSEVPEEVGCSPRWSADGEYLVSADGSVAMRPDGSGRVELEGAAAWNADEEFTGLSSVSADLSRACLQYDDAETAQPGHTQANRCDRFVDTATGDELELPVEADNPNVVFLANGWMIVCDDQYGQIVLSLVDTEGNVADTRTLPGQSSGGTILRGYYVG